MNSTKSSGRSVARYLLSWLTVMVLLIPTVPVAAQAPDGQDDQPTAPTVLSTPSSAHIVPPSTPRNPAAVLWNQPISTVNQNAYANQEFVDPADDPYDIFIADDFANSAPWYIDTIFVPGSTWNTGCDLTCATTLHWQIYGDAGGEPDGHPYGGGNPPIWDLSLPPADSHVTLSTGVDGWLSNVTLSLATPISLPPGTWWLVFYPAMEFAPCCQYGRHVAATTNGHAAQVINPLGGFGFPTTWTSVTSASTWDLSTQDIAFRLEGTIPPPIGPLQYEFHDIDDDNTDNSSGNDDGVVNPGETIEMYVTLRNYGVDTVTGVEAAISTSSSYVTWIYNTFSPYPDVPGGSSSSNINDFDFEVDPSTPDGHVIHFDLLITASNGGPWSDSFDVTVVGGGVSGTAALISDQTELQAITPILDGMGMPYDVMNNNWNGTQGIYTSDYGFLSNYGVVVWYASGNSWGRNITQQEHDALEQFVQAGGGLLVTGYDTLGHPTDPLLADLVRSSSSGDGPFTYDYTISSGSHPIADGPYGYFPTGTPLVAADSDHDMAEADTGRGATTVAQLSSGHDKIIATELPSGGKIVYWNGNQNASDWTGILTALQEQRGDGEHKREPDGEKSIGSLSIDDLGNQAEPVALADNPPEANYDGEGPVWVVPPEALSQAQTGIVPLGSQSVTFPATGDTIDVTYDPYWWHAGDYAEGSRTLSMDSVNRVDYNLFISYNSLNSTGHVDFSLYINGAYVGSFTVLPGEYSKLVSFSFNAISGPVYNVRLEETNTVDPGAGSITIPLDTSYMTFFGPSTAEQVALLQNTLDWLMPVTPPGDPHEPNNHCGQCTPIFADVPITDPTIDPAGDYDYYCFTSGGGHTISADIDAQVNGSPLDSVLTLFDSNCSTLLAENDDHSGLDSYLQYTLPHDGIYYLRVREYNHPNEGGGNFSYSILLHDTPPSQAFPFFDDMESGINGWGVDGLWHQVQDGVSPYPNSHSPTHSWWYGQDSTGDYDTGAANSGNLTSPPVAIPSGTQASLSFWQWYETEPTLSPQSIYFDVYHDTDGDDISGGSYTDWANDLSNEGHTVVEYNQPIDLATLSGHQVLALFDPEVTLTTAEITAINAFMQDGGRVVALGEWGDLGGTNTILNALSSAHGITFNDDTVLDTTDNDGGDDWPLIHNFADHPLVQGANTVVFYAGCSLALSSPAVPLATGDDDTFVTSAILSAAGVGDEDANSSDQSAAPQAIIPGAPVVMAYAQVGDGELIAIGDSNPWTDADPDGDGDIALDEYSNTTLSRRMFSELIDYSAFDQKWIQISVDGGPFQDLQQVTGGPMNTWHEYNVSLAAYEGSTVRIRYHFDTIDSLYNNHRGWYIDDVHIGAISSDVGPIRVYDYYIDDDNIGESSGNGDGWPDPGETIEMTVVLINEGSATAFNVSACLSEASPYVDGFLFNTCANYGDIPGSGTASNLGASDFDFVIDLAAPIGHVIHFDVGITADNGGPWTDAFGVTVGSSEPNIVYSGYDIDDDNYQESVGNGDGLVNPGETIELYVEAGNIGNATASSVEGCIAEYSPYVDGFLFNTCSGYGDIPGGGAAWNYNDFDFEVDPDTPGGHIIHFCIDFSAANGGPWSACFDIPVIGPLPNNVLRVEPPDQDVCLSGGDFHVDVEVENVSHLGAFQFDLVYDPSIVRINSPADVDLGPFLGSTGCSVMEVGPTINNAAGRLRYAANIIGACNGPSGDGVVATVTFDPVGVGDSNLTLENEQLLNTDYPPSPIAPVNLYHGHVTVENCFFADVDRDGDVDITDIYNIAYRWGCQCGETCYVAAYDLNDDCAISISDIQIAACYFGWPNGNFSGCYVPTGSGIGPLSEQSATLRMQPEEIHAQPGESFTVDLTVEDVQDLAGFEALLHYDPRILRFDGLALGDFLASTGNAAEPREAQVNLDAGTVTLGGFSIGEQDSPDGSGTLVTLTFTVQGAGASTLALSDVQLAQQCGLAQPTPASVNARVISGRSLYLPLVHK